MRILITNDDGIESEGIHQLVRTLSRSGHELLVVAPASDWSGAGAALGNLDPQRPLDVRRVEIPGAEGVPAWGLAGPPALTVVASRLGAFGEPPDLVVSGINAGLNTGRSILHSGTVGAVLAAQNFGISGLAVSVDASEPWEWATAAELALEVLPRVVAAPARSAVNLNVPAVPREQVKGIRWARIAPFGAVRAVMGAATDSLIEFRLEPTGYEPPLDTDQGCVDAGYASLTTLVGIVEAWPTPIDGEAGDMSVEAQVVPGAELHPVHEVPDASDHRLLRRPALGG